MKVVATALAVLALLPGATGAQATGVLRVSVALADADGTIVPIPRVLLLVSDNPATAAPRRVRTGLDGTVELRLPPGNYTVETDQPVSLLGRLYGWTQMIDVGVGSDAVLALTAGNADITSGAGSSATAGGSIAVDSAIIFNKWQRSVVEIWTPTAHATGFLADTRGLVATNYRAIADATDVEVQFSDVRVPGRVIASDRLAGVTLIWTNPVSAASLPAVPIDCGRATNASIQYDDRVVAMIAPMLEPKDALAGTVTRVEAQAFQVDWRLPREMAGGPVFAGADAPIGITVADEPDLPPQRRADSYVIPIANVCPVLAAAEKKMSAATPPAASPLRAEPPRASEPRRKPADPKAPRLQVPTLSSDDFEVSLMTPAMARSDANRSSPRTDFANWAEYVAKAPPVLLVRVTPQFEESLWRTLARGAAQTQGVALPPMKSFTASFLRMRAFCGAAEVAPIHPLIIERPVAERAAIREGLYVYALGDFGPGCGTVRFDLYSEKSGQKADSRTIDPSLFTLIAGQS